MHALKGGERILNNKAAAKRTQKKGIKPCDEIQSLADN
jgi:hypothetical protein